MVTANRSERFRKSRLALSGLGLLLLAACGRDGGQEPTSDGDENASAFRVIGGRNSADPTVVLYGCTATIVGPRTVVSAAHCFHPNRPTRGTRHLQVGDKKIRADFVPHPNFDGYNFDVAVGFTDEDMDVKPREIADRAWSGQGATITGFGCNSPSGSGYRVQRTASVHLTGMVRERWMGRNFIDGMLVRLDGYRNQPAVACPGDSGGPVFQHGKLVGVISRSATSRAQTWYTRVTAGAFGIQRWMASQADAEQKPICGITSSGALGKRGCQSKLYDQEIRQARARIADGTAQRRALQREVGELGAQIRGLTNALNATRNRIATVEATVQRHRTAMTGTQDGSQRTRLEAEIATAQSQLSTLRASAAADEQLLRQAQRQETSAQGRLSRVDQSLAELTALLKRYGG